MAGAGTQRYVALVCTASFLNPLVDEQKHHTFISVYARSVSNLTQLLNPTLGTIPTYIAGRCAKQKRLDLSGGTTKHAPLLTNKLSCRREAH